MRLLTLFLILACCACSGPSSPPAPASPTLADLSGPQWSDDVLVANGVFFGHHLDPVLLLLDGTSIQIDVPILGTIDGDLTRTETMSIFNESWELVIDDTYTLRLHVDGYRRIFLTIGDGGWDGKSNTIGWRFDPEWTGG